MGYSESDTSRRYSSTTHTSSLEDQHTRQDWFSRLEDFSEISAQSSLFPGDHLHPLAAYLGQPNKQSSLNHDSAGFAVLYDFGSDGQTSMFGEPSQLEDLKERNALSTSQQQLLFVRGHPSHEWVNAIGNTFDVDPAFIFQHLGFYSRTNIEQVHSSSLLASRSATWPCLRLITRGALSRPVDDGRSKIYMDELRTKVEASLAKYLKGTRTDLEDIRVGESLLRNICVHDAEHFTLEQNISICSAYTAKGWFVLAWLDVGLFGLGDGAHGKFLRAPLLPDQENTVFRSIPFTPSSFGSERPQTYVPSGSGFTRPATIPQNASHLWHEYGRIVDRSLARSDSFYAVSLLFELCAASNSQSLDMIHDVVRKDIRQATILNCEDAALGNLLYNQTALSEYVSFLQDNIFSIESRGSWPRTTPLDTTSTTEPACINLLNDYRGLLRRARDILSECDRGIRKVEHLASQAESRRANEQAKGVARLTRLAFVFVPMSFTAAFFGMNFEQFGQGSLQLWVWVAVTVPIVFISLLLMVSKIRQKMISCLCLRHKQHKLEHREVELGLRS